MSRDLLVEFEEMVQLAKRGISPSEDSKKQFIEAFKPIVSENLKKAIIHYELTYLNSSKIHDYCIQEFWGYFWNHIQNYDMKDIYKHRVDEPLEEWISAFSEGFVIIVFASTIYPLNSLFDKVFEKFYPKLINETKKLIREGFWLKGKHYDTYYLLGVSREEERGPVKHRKRWDDESKTTYDLQHCSSLGEIINVILYKVFEKLNESIDSFKPWKASLYSWVRGYIKYTTSDNIIKEDGIKDRAPGDLNDYDNDYDNDYGDLDDHDIYYDYDNHHKNNSIEYAVIYTNLSIEEQFEKALKYLTIFFSIKIYPWKLLTTSFARLFLWKPLKIVKELSGEKLSRILEMLKDEFIYYIGIEDDYVLSMLKRLKTNLEKRADELINSQDSYYYSMLSGFTKVSLGELELQRFYPSYNELSHEELLKKYSLIISRWKNETLKKFEKEYIASLRT